MRPSKKLLKKDQLYIDDSKFRTLIEKSSDVIVLIDAKGKVLYATPSIIRLYGRSYKEILGENGISFVHPLDAPILMKKLAQMLLRPGSMTTAECRVKHKDGSWRWVEVIATNLLHDSDIRAIVVNCHDITDRKELESKKDEFIVVASHELKSPITALKGYVQILDTELRDTNKKAKGYIEIIKQQIDRISQLINDLLDVSRIQGGRMELHMERCNIEQLIKCVVEDMQKTTKYHLIKIKGEDDITISVDKQRFTQVLTNLLSNAIKYSPKSNKITVRFWKENEGVCVSVSDFGIGIAKKDLSRIFEQFYQAKNVTHFGTSGMGLGLYICSEIVSKHGGNIRVESRKGKGSTFTVWIPLKDAKHV